MEIHGGPTAAASPVFSTAVQYWTSRGFAVVDVNYGGSTGYGRAFREELLGQWGIVDVADCLAAARHLARTGRVDGERLAIRGGSAGGFTTLAALARDDTPFAAGADHFGVADLEALARDTHKFESRYLDRLVGPYPAARDVYVERSPIHHVDRLTRPLIVLQGSEDAIVPPAQSETIVEALREPEGPRRLPALRRRAARLPARREHPQGPGRRALLLRPGAGLQPARGRGHRAGAGREPLTAQGAPTSASVGTSRCGGAAVRRPRARRRCTSSASLPRP